MSFLIYAIFFAVKFLNKNSYKNALFFALTLSIAINIRVVGIYLLLIFIFFFIIKNLMKNNLIKNYKVLFFIFLHSFTILFLAFFIGIAFRKFCVFYKSFSNFSGLNVFYLGNFYLVNIYHGIIFMFCFCNNFFIFVHYNFIRCNFHLFRLGKRFLI